MKWFSISTPSFTCAIAVKNNTIVQSAPILKRFVKQEISSLFNWLDSKFEDYKVEALEEEPGLEDTDVV